MTPAFIIVICTLLLFAYVFDLTAAKTRIPSVILLLLLGWSVRQFTTVFNEFVPDLEDMLPFLGTLGLILIVLDGTLEIELNSSKKSVIIKSVTVALLPILALGFLLSFAFRYYLPEISFRDAFTNAIPFCVISSAIAIPSARYLSAHKREFITYESSLSDIFGIIIFNFVALNKLALSHNIGESVLLLLIMIVVSFAATVLLAFLLSKIDHHIKFIPIILSILLIYSVAITYHLPALILILIFGLFLGNLDEMKRFSWIRKLKPDLLNKEVARFKELIAEATFLVRALFFLLFGFLIETKEIMNVNTFAWAVGIVLAIMIIRAIQFKISNIGMFPMLFIAPRGLINILLFLSIIPAQQIALVNKSLLIQVVLIMALVMMTGLMITGNKRLPKTEKTNEAESTII
ncbi:MAG: sodium:proton antiporter [Chitinophagaceae bacterium]|nr:sodium:proton antiporter [Chitinophagaceae bacterium]